MSRSRRNNKKCMGNMKEISKNMNGLRSIQPDNQIKTKMQCNANKAFGITNQVMKLLPTAQVCIFCCKPEDSELHYGELILHPSTGIRIHYFCLILASGLTQSVTDDTADQCENMTIYGFSICDIMSELKRAMRLHCNICRKKRATIGCVIPSCKVKLHYPCAKESGALSQFYGTFQTYCSRHRPKQIVRTAEDFSSEVRNQDDVDHFKQAETEGVRCPICLDSLTSSTEDLNLVTTPCCLNVWLHRTCVQRQALSFGLYFFRCPVCNDAERFPREMQRMGIYLPERDAAWESQDGAFSELLQRHTNCDVPLCNCPHGRDYNLKRTRWAIVLCDFCGSNGTHVGCHGDVDHDQSYYVCHNCELLHDGADRARAFAVQMGVLAPPVDDKKKSRAERASKRARRDVASSSCP